MVSLEVVVIILEIDLFSSLWNIGLENLKIFVSSLALLSSLESFEALNYDLFIWTLLRKEPLELVSETQSEPLRLGIFFFFFSLTSIVFDFFLGDIGERKF